MKAGTGVINEVLESLDRGDASALQKFAVRYKDDRELQDIYALFQGNKPRSEVKTRLQRLHDLRKFEAAGTHLPLKDRRNLTSDRKKMEDY
ncbi:MAG: hypothetical protein V1744_08440 [Candidatus Altiarchaeota archaeon]